jgi:predicted SprT family Zn-dependent metalloprotease
MPSEVVAFAETLLDDLFARFPLGARPKIVWKNLRVTAGMAYYKQNQIGLSRLILTDEARVRDTLTHEYAHLLAVHRKGPKAACHGVSWAGAMLEMGAEPRVRHNYEVRRNRRHMEVVYLCAKCGTRIVRPKRLPRKRRYLHVNCGGEIRFACYTAVTPPDGTS